MAVTERTQTISSGWTRDQIISALETAFSNAGLHGAGLTGLVQGFFDSGTSTQYSFYGPISQGASGGGTTVVLLMIAVEQGKQQIMERLPLEIYLLLVDLVVV